MRIIAHFGDHGLVEMTRDDLAIFFPDLVDWLPEGKRAIFPEAVPLLPPEIGIYVWGAWDVFEEIGPGRRRRYRHPLLINVPEDDVDHLIEAWLYHMDLLTTFNDVCRRLAERPMESW